MASPTSLTLRLFLRGPLVDSVRISEVLDGLETTRVLRPTQFGWIETKRRAYERRLAASYDPKFTSLLLWSAGGSEADSVELGDTNPLAASFSRPWAEAGGVLQDVSHLIELLRPVFVSVLPVFDWASLAAEEPDLAERARSIRGPASPALIQRLGFGDLPPASYIDDGIASAIGPEALSILEATRFGTGYLIGRLDLATLSDVTGYLRQRLASHEVLRAHGLAGRVGQTPQMPTYYGPRWKAPTRWSRKRPAVAERRLAGPNV